MNCNQDFRRSPKLEERLLDLSMHSSGSTGATGCAAGIKEAARRSLENFMATECTFSPTNISFSARRDSRKLPERSVLRIRLVWEQTDELRI